MAARLSRVGAPRRLPSARTGERPSGENYAPDPVERQVESLLAEHGPLTLDELIGRAKRDRWQILQALNVLRVRGQIEQEPDGPSFRLTAERRWQRVERPVGTSA